VSKMVLILGLVIFFGCEKSPNSILRSQGAVRAEIPFFRDNVYQLAPVEIETLTSLDPLRGQAAEFLYHPNVRNSELQGATPKPHFFFDTKGFVTAGDLNSLELLTLYYHFEKLMLMDQQLGIFYKNSWPRKIFLEARVLDHSNRISYNNARYVHVKDVYMFDSFISQQLHLTLNSGVIAHEHFHSLFAKMVLEFLALDFPTDSPHEVSVLSEDQKNQNQLYVASLLRTWNEGLADVWGWIYSRDFSFIERSIVTQESRDLSLKPEMLPSSDKFRRMVLDSKSEIFRLSMNYYVASMVSRVIFQMSEGLDPLDVARAILGTFPKIVRSMQSESFPSPSLIFFLLLEDPIFHGRCDRVLPFVSLDAHPKNKDLISLCPSLDEKNQNTRRVMQR
jgi:hypothetical protein